ncbi:hypothetical protein TNCV_2523291 [Trichonephila clavipes]|nr:hypothetical protein TNCV_2523291 [Trichonephila clavipes]
MKDQAVHTSRPPAEDTVQVFEDIVIEGIACLESRCKGLQNNIFLIFAIKEINPFYPRSCEIRHPVERRDWLSLGCDVLFPSLSYESETDTK